MGVDHADLLSELSYQSVSQGEVKVDSIDNNAGG